MWHGTLVHSRFVTWNPLFLENFTLFLVDEPGYDDFISASNFEYETKNYKQAKIYYEKACEAEHPMGLVNYALWFLEGDCSMFASTNGCRKVEPDCLNAAPKTAIGHIEC